MGDPMPPIEEPGGGVEDAALMRRVASMDADAFELLYDRHSGSAYALAYRIVGTRQAADDVSQEAFLAVWRSAGHYDPRLGNVRSWILTVVRNRAIDHLRRVTRTKERETFDEALAERHPAPAGEQTENAAIQRATDGETRGLLEELSDDQRRVIELSFYSGYSHSEIAGMLELPLGTVKARMNRGLARMRKAVTAAGGPS
jgi:RNA polymerase sigma-70 factor (ECF subfamily)